MKYQSTTTLTVSGLADFPKGNYPDKRDLWKATDHFGTIALHFSTLGSILKKSYYTHNGETQGIIASYGGNSESGLYYYRARYYAVWIFVSRDLLGCGQLNSFLQI